MFPDTVQRPCQCPSDWDTMLLSATKDGSIADGRQTSLERRLRSAIARKQICQPLIGRHSADDCVKRPPRPVRSKQLVRGGLGRRKHGDDLASVGSESGHLALLDRRTAASDELHEAGVPGFQSALYRGCHARRAGKAGPEGKGHRPVKGRLLRQASIASLVQGEVAHAIFESLVTSMIVERRMFWSG